ncbi:hypothetical protein EVAR_17796_1 [Eumeta japonica]|uniref:Uncharacterized protein n=1 Tax=Eumeta variegata TaxID=151549 RepID=A0A4C1TTT0_EUMVA|nr:hypothetical protein EVAR_17796_1 [Eumeta japonica]
MDKHIPIRFDGGSLGDRQKFINQRVRDAIKQNVIFEDIKSMKGQSTVDRLFMINFASKCQNLEYIIENLKDTNMLFVGRALKSTWLITDPRHAHVINPKYLEEELFPQMMTTAVNKMLHRIYIHLKDEERCYDFYQHYKLKKNMEIAKHFLKKCSKNVMLSEIQLFLDDISPHYLKVICEKCPEVFKKYIDTVTKSEKVYQIFSSKRSKYFNALKLILKTEPKIYFEILEQYCDSPRSNHRLSPKATKHIMQKHKDKYWAKPELYGGAAAAHACAVPQRGGVGPRAEAGQSPVLSALVRAHVQERRAAIEAY